MARLFDNFQFGTISNNPLSAGATSITSAEFANMRIVSGDTLVLVLDPEDKNGNGQEIVYVTAHAASGTTVTVTRGEEGTTGIEHAQNTEWAATVTREDMERLDAIEADDWVTSARLAAGAVDNAALAGSGLDVSKFTTGTSDRDTTGNAATATRWATSRTITLSGDVSGSTSINGAANVSITAVVANDSHTHGDSTIDGLNASATTAGRFDTARMPLNISGLTTIEANYFEADVDGTSAAPAHTWDSHLDSGLYYDNDTNDEVRISVAGTDAGKFQDTGYHGGQFIVGTGIATSELFNFHYHATSRREYKQDIRPLDEAKMVAELMALTPVEFRYRRQFLTSDMAEFEVQRGMIAEDVAEVSPELASFTIINPETREPIDRAREVEWDPEDPANLDKWEPIDWRTDATLATLLSVVQQHERRLNAAGIA